MSNTSDQERGATAEKLDSIGAAWKRLELAHPTSEKAGGGWSLERTFLCGRRARPVARHDPSPGEGPRMTDGSADRFTAEAQAAAELLPAVYAELRRLAAVLTGQLPPGQTLQPTALVHEAYLKLVRDQDPGWEGRRHFFGAAAQAMREILVEQARRKDSLKRGGSSQRVELAEGLALIKPPADDLLALDEAIQQLQAEKPHLAEVV